MRLEMSLSMRPEMQMQLRLTPQMIQSMELLQIPIMELERRMEQELLENPVLEVREAAADPQSVQDTSGEDATRRVDDSRTASGEMTEPEVSSDDIDNLIKIGNELREYNDYFNRTNRRRSFGDGDHDPKHEAIENTAAPAITLQDALQEQLHFLVLDDKLKEAVSYLINNLDRKGYLTHDLDSLTASGNGREPYSPQILCHALQILQHMDPRGVGARDLQECLLLQLGAGPEHAFERKLVREHLNDILHNRLPRIVKETGQSMDRVKAAIGVIQSLNPNPGSMFVTESAPPILPDVEVKLVNGRYEVILEEGKVSSICISPIYRKLLEEKHRTSESFQYIKKKMESAKWLLDAIRQRKHTLRRIAEKLVARQRDFLDQGISGLKPLRMQEIADELKIHVSTVSRAVMDKYIQVPRGIYPMKFFFTGGTVTEDGENTSTHSVKQIIREACSREDPQKPYSDDQLVEILQKRGIKIARRTVTKYRKTLGLPSSRERKAY